MDFQHLVQFGVKRGYLDDLLTQNPGFSLATRLDPYTTRELNQYFQTYNTFEMEQISHSEEKNNHIRNTPAILEFPNMQ